MVDQLKVKSLYQSIYASNCAESNKLSETVSDNLF